MICHAVAWRGIWRVIDQDGRVVAVCETEDEAESYIAGQTEQVTP